MTKPITYQTCSVRGVLRAYTPEQITQGMQQGDASVALLADGLDILPGPPRAQDALIIDGAVWTIQGVYAVHDGADLIGYTLQVRGGQ